MRMAISAGLGAAAVLFVTGCNSDITAPSSSKLSTVALPAITFDASTGLGFVGKGDVQYTYGWNNAQLQNNAALVRFQVNVVEVSEYAWTCHRFTGPGGTREIIQERANTTTTSLQGLIGYVARERNQVTGFVLTGYVGGAVVQSTATDGPAVNSCPASPSGFTLLDAAGAPAVSSFGGGLEISKDAGTTWTALIEKPAL
jgi:hypothetical protein